MRESAEETDIYRLVQHFTTRPKTSGLRKPYFTTSNEYQREAFPRLHTKSLRGGLHVFGQQSGIAIFNVLLRAEGTGSMKGETMDFETA